MPDNTPIEQRIRGWLEQNGYPLELRTAKTLQALRFSVLQSEYYVDPESGRSREIDIIASRDFKIVDRTLFRVSLVIECKESAAKPWVVFSSGQLALAPPARVVQRAANPFGRELLRIVAQEPAAHASPLFHLPGTLAYGATQAFSTGSDAVYAALTSAAKATAFRAQTHTGSLLCQILFPVVVTSARLFSASLAEDASLDVKEIQVASLLWRNPLVDHPFTIVTVIAENALSGYAEEVAASAASLLAELPSRFEQARAGIQRS